MQKMHTDGGYNSPAVDVTMREQHVEQIQSAIRGRKPAAEKLGLDDFTWEVDAEGRPQNVTCPHAQQVPVEPGRKAKRYRAVFAAPECDACPFGE